MRYNLNFKEIDRMLQEQEINGKQLSSIVGKNNSWYCQIRKFDSAIKPDDVQKICDLLGCDVNDIVANPTVSTVRADKPADDDIVLDPTGVESVFEREVKQMLTDIKKQLDADHEILMYLYNCEQQRQNANSFENHVQRATDILDKMQASANGGCVRLNDYRGRLSVVGITDKDVLKTAIRDGGYTTEVHGYGSNKDVWIVRSENEGTEEGC